ncbi:hypothetical protein [Methylopila sp. 73B]|uniref:hypothetical protein n=1 Tax=Methylopila sp. 73B TaxID=1120792 RepID=UPI000371D9E8|nr:hypothetical protein [Methylopila sp. 73B]
MTTAQTNTPPPGAVTEKVTPVEAKQGTDAPKGMPVVLGVGILGAVVAMFLAWMFIF